MNPLRLINNFEEVIMNIHEKKSVIQEWMNELSWKQQTVVLAALRGCDGVHKEDPSKFVHKYMRACVLENAGTTNTPFMKANYNEYDDERLYNERFNRVKKFCRNIDAYPTHYILHFMHAAEIIGYNHPMENVARFWRETYLLFVNAMHLQPETKESNMFRLLDGVDSD